MPKKSRMTAQSKVNIQAAVAATLIPAAGGGYNVKLTGSSGAVAFVENASGQINYPSMAGAKAAVKTHNSSLNPALAPTI